MKKKKEKQKNVGLLQSIIRSQFGGNGTNCLYAGTRHNNNKILSSSSTRTKDINVEEGNQTGMRIN